MYKIHTYILFIYHCINAKEYHLNTFLLTPASNYNFEQLNYSTWIWVYKNLPE